MHVIAPAASGGAETVIRHLAKAQRTAGIDARVVATISNDDHSAHPFLHDLELAGVVPHVVRVSGRAYLRERKEFRKLLGEVRPLIVQTHGYRPDVVLGGVVDRLGITRISTIHGFTGGGIRNALYEWMLCRSAATADAVVAVSDATASALTARRVPARRVHVIPNAMGEPDFLPRQVAITELGLADRTFDFRVAWIGRMSREKGPDVALEAFAGTGGAFQLVMIGDGPELQALRAAAARLPAETRAALTILGARSNASKYLLGFDALLLSSRTEGTPMVLLEALWAGLPIVATDVGGVAAAVGEAAQLCPTEDSTELARAIQRLAGSEALRHEYSRRARERAIRLLDTRAWVASYQRLYAAAIEGRTRNLSK